jgi:uncharacterized protein (TIGR01777 family)
MKVFLTGGSGFIGRRLAERLHAGGHSVVVVSRSGPSSQLNFPAGTEVIKGDPTVDGEWLRKIPACDAVINLAGESVFGRWSPARKSEIRRSRLEATKNVVRAVASAQRPMTLINASAIGFYGPHPHQTMTEKSPAGRDFLAQVCKEWEAAANLASQYNCRVATVRIGVVLHPTGGALQKMLPPFRAGLGGWIGTGKQWMSWIHRDDLIELIVRILESPHARGAFNATAPQPATNRDFSQALAKKMGKPCAIPVPAFALKLALGESSTLVLDGQRVIPARAKEIGFEFKFPSLDLCLDNLVGPNSGFGRK